MQARVESTHVPSLLAHIPPRGWLQSGDRGREALRSVDLLAGAAGEPLGPVGPPGAVVGLRPLAPLVQIGRRDIAHPVAVLLLLRMIDDAGDMAGLRKHETAAALQPRQAFERGSPGRDVILLAGDGVVRDPDVVE